MALVLCPCCIRVVFVLRWYGIRVASVLYVYRVRVVFMLHLHSIRIVCVLRIVFELFRIAFVLHVFQWCCARIIFVLCS